MNGGTFNFGYEAIEVNNLSYERNIAKKNWDALKMTFRDMMDVEYDPNNDIIYNMMVDVMNGNHNPSWLKVATIGCEFRNISRICLAQITRDTGWIWNSESQMPQRLEHNITVPLNIAMNEKWLDKLEDIQNEIEELYDELIDAGIPYQDAEIISLHGIGKNVWLPKFEAALSNTKKIFILTSGLKDLHEAAKLILDYNRNAVVKYKMAVGFMLSYENESTEILEPEKVLSLKEEGLYSAFIITE